MADSDCFESFEENSSVGRGFESDFFTRGMSDNYIERESKKRKFATPSPNKSYAHAIQTPATVRYRPLRNAPRPSVPDNQHIIISARGVRLAEENPIKIQKNISKEYGIVKNIRPIRSGNIIVNCMDGMQLKQLMKATQLGEWQVKCSKPQSLLSSQGCIYNVPQEYSEEDIKYALNEYGVTKATRLTYYDKQQAKRAPSRTIKLFFSIPQMPTSVCIGFLKYRVKLFVPMPIQCYNCQQFGHVATNCKREKACVKCSLRHEGQCNSDTAVCVNCKGPHQSNSKDCPKRVEKQKALKKSKELKISVGEATKIVKGEDTKTFVAEKELNKQHISKTKTHKKTILGEANITASQMVSIMTIAITHIINAPKERITVENVVKYISEVAKTLNLSNVDTDQMNHYIEKSQSIRI
ncbi:unnamed protein product [Mytilus edulis]|uniref:CCHC-type domain-containing protein n=1 Tax=Mytilus edulis TaxID=6550 RepID=A0A8S3SH57_MYTED|nr:unnamed protein product [Mytilus edulis]